MASTALIVAIAAGALLVVVIGGDVTYNRTVYVDARTAQGGWTTITQDPCCQRYEYHYGPTTIDANRSDDVAFRLRVDNGYPLSYQQSFVVLVGGVETTRGTLLAPSRSEGVAEFSVPAEAFLGPNSTVVPEKGAITHGPVEVVIGGKHLYVSPGIREVAR